MENGDGMTGSCRGLDEGEWEVQGVKLPFADR